MKFLNKKGLGAIMFSFVALTSCKKDFLDVNDDPNRGTDANITANLIFPQAADLAGGQALIGSQGFAEKWVGYFASNGDYARDQTETSYNISFNFGNTLWANYYNALFDLYLTKQKALADSNLVLAGASMILSAKLFQEVVDTWGSVPYSQAFQETKYPLPAYDKAQDIYSSLQKSLDTAIEYMATTAPLSFTTIDVVNHGDQDLWIKFANTLKLRLLIRQSEVPGFSPASEIAKITQDGDLYILGPGESVGVNPGYSNQLNKQSPFYANYGYTPTGVKATASTSANAYIIDILSKSGDPRLDQFFQPAGGKFVGDVYGDEPGNIPSGSQTSYFGPGIIGSDLSGGAGASQDQWLMPSFESMFLGAEAIARGWVPNSTTDARTAYEDAVIESFEWLNVPDADNEASTYLTDRSIANWDNAGPSASSKAKFIAFQKYIAMCGIDPLEAWADQRRLNFLPSGFISANPSRGANKLPLRLLYPQTEYTNNGDNVKQEGNINQFTSKIFWQP